MTDQTFYGPADQVAGRDINNYGGGHGGNYGGMSTDELYQQRGHYRALLWAARKRLLLNVPNAVFALVMLGLAAYAIQMIGVALSGSFGSTDSQPAAWLFFGGIIVVVGVPLYFVIKTRKREGAIISDCRYQLQLIDIELNRQGKA